MVAYWSDVFIYLNDLYFSIEGRAVTISKVEDKVEAMINKTDMQSGLPNGEFDSFPTLDDFLTASDNNLSQEIKTLIFEHLKSLKNNFRDNFPLPGTNNKWIKDPFNVDVKKIYIRINCK